jgi:hypothetical protein
VVFPPQAGNFSFKEFYVERKTHLLDEAMLFRSQNISRSTDLKVPHGKLQTRTGSPKLKKCFKAFPGLRSKMPWIKEVGVGFPVKTPYPSPELIELCQPKKGGKVHDEGIGPGDIDANLHDSGGKEKGYLPAIEPLHHSLEFPSPKPSMGHGKWKVREELPKLLLHPEKIPNTGANIEHLTSSRNLPANGFLYGFGVPGQNKGVYGFSALRRCFDNTDVSNAQKRKVERPGNRSSRKGQNIHVRPKLFEVLLVHDPKALFLVNDEET